MHVAFVDTSNPAAIRLSYSTWDGTSWHQTASTVPIEFVVGLAIDSQDRPAVLVEDLGSSGTHNYSVGLWNGIGFTFTPLNLGSSESESPTIAVTGDGTVHVIYVIVGVDFKMHHLRFGTGPAGDVVGELPLSLHPLIATDPQGDLWIAYQDHLGVPTLGKLTASGWTHAPIDLGTFKPSEIEIIGLKSGPPGSLSVMGKGDFSTQVLFTQTGSSWTQLEMPYGFVGDWSFDGQGRLVAITSEGTRMTMTASDTGLADGGLTSTSIPTVHAADEAQLLADGKGGFYALFQNGKYSNQLEMLHFK